MNVWDKIEKTKLKLLTKFHLLLQPYLVHRKRLQTYFQTTKYPYGFSDHIFHLFFTISFAIFHHGSRYLATTVVINGYGTLHLTKISAAIF